MPARITVKAELANLLAKSQETTDANRQAQLRKEADRKEDRRRLEAKRAKETAATKKPLEDPVGRNIFTAAMGGGFPVALVFNVQSTNEFWSTNQLSNITLNVPDLGLPGGDIGLGDDSYVRGFFYDEFDQIIGFADRQFRSVEDAFVLPLGKDRMIFFRHGRRAAREYKWNRVPTDIPPTYTIAYDDQAQAAYTQALFVSKTAIKEITVPAFMLARCLELCEEYELSEPTQSSPSSQPVFPAPFLTDGWENAIGFQSVSRESYVGTVRDFGAGIYEYILDSAPVARPRIKLRTCDVAGNCPLFAPDPQYRERITFESTTDLISPSPAYQPYRTADIRLIDPVGNAIFTSRYYSGWDWNNPAYCRQQALACGFAPADLAP